MGRKRSLIEACPRENTLDEGILGHSVHGHVATDMLKLQSVVLAHQFGTALKRLDKQMEEVVWPANHRQLNPKMRISRRILEGRKASCPDRTVVTRKVPCKQGVNLFKGDAGNADDDIEIALRKAPAHGRCSDMAYVDIRWQKRHERATHTSE